MEQTSEQQSYIIQTDPVGQLDVTGRFNPLQFHDYCAQPDNSFRGEQ